MNPGACCELFDCVIRLADFVIPAQYGITNEDKVSISYEVIKI